MSNSFLYEFERHLMRHGQPVRLIPFSWFILISYNGNQIHMGRPDVRPHEWLEL